MITAHTTHRRGPRGCRAVAALAAVALALVGASTAGAVSTTYTHSSYSSGTAWTVPAGVTSITVTVYGGAAGSGGYDGQSGGAGGPWGRVAATLAVTGGDEIGIYPGDSGANGAGCVTNTGGGAGGADSYSGGDYSGGAGGNAGSSGCSGGGGGGGAASLLTKNGTIQLIAAGAGGGGGDSNTSTATAGTTGATRASNTNGGDGTFGGACGNTDGGGGGGGGGGYRGGTGGTAPSENGECTGHGGSSGSNYIIAGATSTTDTTETSTSETITITYTAPPSVTSFTSAQATPTRASSFTYALAFAAAVTDVTAEDFSNAGTADGCTFAPGADSGSTRTVTVSGCTDGTVKPRFRINGALDANGQRGPAAAADATTVITVDQTNDAPTLGDASTAYTDTTAVDDFPVRTGTLSASDPDPAPNTLTYGIDGGTAAGGSVSLTRTYGTLVVNQSSGAWTFTPDDAAVNAATGSASDAYTITVSDGGLADDATFTVQIAGSTDVPGAPVPDAVTKGNLTLSVAFTAPAFVGDAAISDYQYSTDNGSTWRARQDGGGTESPLVISTLSSNGSSPLVATTSYTIRLRAVNAGGGGVASSAVTEAAATVPGTPATSSSLRLIADNDFAVLTGTSANVTRLFYQNNVDWPSQIAAATTVDVTLEPGETHLYVVGMGGGGSEDLAGKINGVDITQIADAQRAVIPACAVVSESSASNCYRTIDASLVDGSATNGNQGGAYASSLGQIAGGSFAVRLADVQSALAGATWQTLPGGGAYPFRSSSPVGCSGASPTPNRCFDIPDSRAVVFRFAAGDIDVPVLAGNQSVTVRWSQPGSNGGSAITSYDVQQSLDGTTWSNPASTAACTPAADRCRVVTGLTNGTPYRFRVRAVNAIGPGSWSAATSQATPSGPPGAPTGLALVPADGTATATWAAPDSGGTAITGYTVEVDAGSGWTTAAATACPTPADTCRVLTGLANGTAHAVRVTAANANGPGPASATASTTPRTVPGAPRNVAASRGVRSLTVAFDPPASNGGAAITNYAYAVSTDGGATWGAFTALSPASTTSPLTVPGLVDDAPYAVRVRAINVAGDGAISAEATARTFALPAAPTAVQARAGVGLATVTWGAPDDGGTPVTGYTVTASPGGRTCEWSSGTLDCVVTGLTNGVEYTFTVTATNAAGTGPASAASAPVTPKLAQVPAAAVEELARDSTEVSRGGAARVAVACGEGGPCRTAVRMRIGDQVLTTTGTLQPGESSTAGIDLPPEVQRRLAWQGRLTVTVTIQIASEAGTIAVAVELELEAPPADRVADWSGRPRTDGSTDVAATCEGPIVTRCEGILTLYVDDPAGGAARQGGRIAVGTVAVAGPAGHPIKVNAKINRRGRQILARERTIRIAPSVVFEGQTDPGRIRPYRLTLMSEQEWLRAALATLSVGGRPRADLNVLLDEVRGGRLDAATAADRIEEDILRRRLTGQAAALDLPVPPRALVPIERDLQLAFALSVAANRHYLAYLRTGDDDRWGSAWRLSARATDVKARMLDRFAEAGRRLGVDVPSAAPRWP